MSDGRDIEVVATPMLLQHHLHYHHSFNIYPGHTLAHFVRMSVNFTVGCQAELVLTRRRKYQKYADDAFDFGKDLETEYRELAGPGDPRVFSDATESQEQNPKAKWLITNDVSIDADEDNQHCKY